MFHGKCIFCGASNTAPEPPGPRHPVQCPCGAYLTFELLPANEEEKILNCKSDLIPEGLYLSKRALDKLRETHPVGTISTSSQTSSPPNAPTAATVDLAAIAS